MSSKNSPSRYYLFCEPCGFKGIIEKNEDHNLTPIPTAPIPGGAPKLDPVTKKTVVSKAIPQMPKFKCPKCGRGVSAKHVPPTIDKIFKQREDAAKQKERKKELEKEGFVNKALDGTDEKNNNSRCKTGASGSPIPKNPSR